jgi:hypothetical protein
MESRVAEAKPFLLDALRVALERGWRTVAPYPLDALAAVFVEEGDASGAARLLGAADALRVESGLRTARPRQSDSRERSPTLVLLSAMKALRPHPPTARPSPPSRPRRWQMPISPGNRT